MAADKTGATRRARRRHFRVERQVAGRAADRAAGLLWSPQAATKRRVSDRCAPRTRDVCIDQRKWPDFGSSRVADLRRRVHCGAEAFISEGLILSVPIIPSFE